MRPSDATIHPSFQCTHMIPYVSKKQTLIGGFKPVENIGQIYTHPKKDGT